MFEVEPERIGLEAHGRSSTQDVTIDILTQQTDCDVNTLIFISYHYRDRPSLN